MNSTTKFEVSSCLLEDLSLIGQANITNEGFRQLIETVCDDVIKIQILGNVHNSLKILQGNKLLENVEGQKLVRIYSGLSTLILKAASENSPTPEIEKLLIQCNIIQDQVAKFIQVYSEKISQIRTSLKVFEKCQTELVDVNWRLDYQIESSLQGPMHKLFYIIELILNNNGNQETLTFTATQPQLEDLVATLKDACHSVKRVVS